MKTLLLCLSLAALSAFPQILPADSYPTQQSLSDMLSRVDRIRVVDAGLHWNNLVPLNAKRTGQAEILLDTQVPEQLEKFRACFRIVENTNSLWTSASQGRPSFEFLTGTSLVARISLHHGRSIRWEAWSSDALLERNEDVLDWLARNGVAQPKNDYEAERRLAAVPANKKERFVRELQSIQVFGDYLLRTNDCTCKTSIFEPLSNLSFASSATFSKSRKVKFVFVFPSIRTDSNDKADQKDPFANSNPCPIHNAPKGGPPIINYTSYDWMSIWDRVKLLADISGLEVDVDPDTRTVMLYSKE